MTSKPIRVIFFPFAIGRLLCCTQHDCKSLLLLAHLLSLNTRNRVRIVTSHGLTIERQRPLYSPMDGAVVFTIFLGDLLRDGRGCGVAKNKNNNSKNRSRRLPLLAVCRDQDTGARTRDDRFTFRSIRCCEILFHDHSPFFFYSTIPFRPD